MKKILLSLVLSAWCSIAFAQTSPNLRQGQVLTPAQWNQLFINKQDTLGYIPLNVAGGTMGGRLITPSVPSGTSSGFNLTPGGVPPTPIDGDLWATTTGLFARINGTTIGPIGVAACPTCAVTNASNIFTVGPQVINTNAVAAPSPTTTSSFQISPADGVSGSYENNAYGTNTRFLGLRTDGTNATPTTLVLDDEIVAFQGHGYDGVSRISARNAAFNIYSGGTWSNTSHPAYACIGTTAVSSTTMTACRVRVETDGGVTVGGAASQGVGTLNLLNGLYNNGVAPTGTGGYARAISPAFTTPSLGAATATTINGITISASTGTLTLNTNTLAMGGAGISLILTGTGSTTQTFPTTSATLARTDAGQTFNGLQVITGAGGSLTIQTGTASALAVGVNGATNPVFQVDTSTASQAAGLKITGAVTGGTVALAAIDSGSNTNITINAKGTGTIGIGNVSTGNIDVGTGGGGLVVHNSFTATGLVTYGAFASAALATSSQYAAGTANTIPPTSVIYPAETTTTFGATTTFDFSTFINTAVTLTGNITTQTLSNVTAGKSGTIAFIQDGTGSRTTVWNSIFKFASGVTPTLSTGINKVDVLSYSCRSATFCVASLILDAR